MAVISIYGVTKRTMIDKVDNYYYKEQVFLALNTDFKIK